MIGHSGLTRHLAFGFFIKTKYRLRASDTNAALVSGTLLNAMRQGNTGGSMRPVGAQRTSNHRQAMHSPSPYPLGGSFLDYSHMVAKLKLKGIDGRAYCGTAVLLSVPCFAQGRRRPFTT